MKVLLTGASGFIGRHVLHYLRTFLHDDEIVLGLHNEDKRTDDAIASVHFNLDRIEKEDAVSMYTRFHKPDLVIHLAWIGLPNFNDNIHLDQLLLHKIFLGKMAEGGIRKLSVAGTCLEYGLQEGKLREDFPAMPVTVYGKAKLNLLEYVTRLQRKYPFDLTWLRMFYLYGEGQHPGSLLSELNRAISEGEPAFNMSPGNQRRDYMPVEKMGEMIVKVSLQSKISGIVNCCSGESISVKELVLSYLHKHNRRIALNTGVYSYPTYEPRNFWGASEKLKEALEVFGKKYRLRRVGTK